MREQSLVRVMLDKILQETPQPGNPQKICFHIALGELSEISEHAFLTQWNELSKGTPLERAQLQIRLIRAEVQCMACFSKYQPIDKQILCPHCGSFGAKILSGEACTLESIEVDHD